MMPYAVTDGATIQCPFGGTPVLTPSTVLKASGNNVLNQTDVVGKTVGSCSSTTPCVTISSCTPVSTKVTKSGVGVVLTTSVITGSTGHVFVITEGQTVLQATS